MLWSKVFHLMAISAFLGIATHGLALPNPDTLHDSQDWASNYELLEAIGAKVAPTQRHHKDVGYPAQLK